MRSSVFLFGLFLFFMQTDLYACDDWVAKVVSVNGNVEVRNGEQVQTAKVEQTICPGQTLSVGENSRAAIYLSNNSFVRLDQNTVLAFPQQKSQQGFWVELKQGVSHFISRITKRFVVDAPYVNAAVDGTEFIVSADAVENSVVVIEGKVIATQESQGQESESQAVTMGQKLVVSQSESAFRLTEISNKDTIDWAIYYSPIPTLQEIAVLEQNDLYTSVLQHIKQNRPDLALQQLDKSPLSGTGKVAKAAVLLSVGQSQQAASLLSNVSTAQAFALQSVIHSTRNHPKKAVEFAQQAVQKDSQSMSAQLALSYAHQADLNLPAALDAARAATLIGDNNAIAWARVSEMELALGNIRRADKAIAKAQKQDANNPYIVTQAGFIQLFKIKVANAKKLFASAIALDSENPQAHLGLGLAMLRAGDLEQGRKQLEYATSLDPARSVVRSYLGRAYFEEKRDDEAATQWELAKQLDPNDPTPYFYEGVRKLFANDPIGAIEELETSRKLNDERALYRSETLLQSDSASRSATLARAYDEVGYDQGVLLAGWDALKNDPTSAEGHRLLADYYRGNSRYETARASELLQSQLWQPLSAYPLQPQLSETGISVVEGAGPQNPGFNEYHSLFTQDGVYGSATGYGGSDNTWGDDLVGSFLAGPVAVSLGQYHFETDGWRENSGQEQDIYNGFVQWQLAPTTQIQFESRKFDWFQEDIAPEFVGFGSNIDKIDIEKRTNRFGLTHRWSDSFSVVFSAMKQAKDEIIYEDFLNAERRVEARDQNTEIQFYYSFLLSNAVVGLSHSDLEVELVGSEGEIILDIPAPGFINDLGANRESFDDIDEVSAYLYSYTEIHRNITLGLGFSLVDLRQRRSFSYEDRFIIQDPFGGSLDLSQPPVNSDSEEKSKKSSLKLGLEFQVTSKLNTKVAYYEVVSRNLVNNQTIEPTQFLGFNQVFDGANLNALGSESENIGLSIDFDDEIYTIGATGYLRSIESPNYFVLQGEYVDYEYDQCIFELYGVLFPKREYSIDISGLYDRTKQNRFNIAPFQLQASEIENYSIPIGLNLFNENRASVQFQQTYYIQRAKSAAESKSSSTWITGVNASYRFPGQMGGVELGVENILDENEEFVTVVGGSLEFYPARFWYASVNFNL